MLNLREELLHQQKRELDLRARRAHLLRDDQAIHPVHAKRWRIRFRSSPRCSAPDPA